MKNRRTNPQRHVALRLGERNYTFDMFCVREIIFAPDLEPSLDGPEMLIGTFRSSHGPLPVLDILNRQPDECYLNCMAVVILTESEHVVCLLVDDLLDIVEFDSSTASPCPDGANGVPDELIRGVVTIDNTDYFMLDLSQIISSWLGCAEKKASGTGEDLSEI